MSAALETSDRHVDSVSVFVDPFWTTSIFRTFSSGKFYRHRELLDSSTFCMLGGAVGIRVAYPYSLDFSDQLSC